MSRKRLNIDWSDADQVDLNPALKRFKSHLKDIGFRDSTIDPYVGCVKRYLNFASTERPTREDSLKFRETLHEKGLSRSTINNYSFAIKKYHEMLGDSLELPFLKRNDNMPYYFDEDDVQRGLRISYN